MNVLATETRLTTRASPNALNWQKEILMVWMLTHEEHEEFPMQGILFPITSITKTLEKERVRVCMVKSVCILFCFRSSLCLFVCAICVSDVSLCWLDS
jgi:hypothetical protein